MSHFVYTNFKTGIKPSPVRKFNMTNLTNIQKLMLVRNRIFGTTINENYRTGAKNLRKGMQYWRDLNYDWVHCTEAFPWIKDNDEIKRRKDMFEARRLRIVMRGVKIGQKRGSSGRTAANTIFDTKK